MNFRGTVVLGVIAFFLVGFILFINPIIKRSSVEHSQQSELIAPDDVKNATKIELKSNKYEIVCEKIKEDWEIIKPICAKADTTKIDEIIYSVGHLVKGPFQAKSKEVRLVDYGLEKPRLVAKITSNKVYTILFGKESNVYKGYVFIQLEGDENIYTVSTSIFSTFDKDIKTLRNRKIFGYMAYKVDKIIIWQKFLKSKGKELVTEYEESHLVRGENNGWYLEKPFSEKLDDTQVNRLISGLLDVEICDFITPSKDLKKYGLDEPQWRIQLFESNIPKPSEIYFGSEINGSPEGIYAKSPDINEILVVENNKFKSLPKGRDDLRSPIVFNFKKDEMQSILIETKFSRLLIVKEPVEVEEGKNGKVKKMMWIPKEPRIERASTAKIDKFVERMLEMKVSGFMEREPADLETYGLKSPAVKITLGFEKGKDGVSKSRVYILGIPSEEGQIAFLKREGESQVYSLRMTDYNYLAKGELNFIDDLVFDVPLNSIRSFSVEITYRTLDGQEVKDRYGCSFSENEKKWKMIYPKDLQIDDVRVAKILEHLHCIRTQQFITKEPNAITKYGFDKPVMRVVMDYQIEEGQEKRMREKILLIVEPRLRTYYAKFADEEIVFTIGSGGVEKLKQGVHKRPEVEGSESPDEDHEHNEH